MNLTGWWVAVAVIVLIFAVPMLLTNVVFIDRLTLHNATTNPIVFTGARGQPGNVYEADVFVGPCEQADFEWGVLGWTTDRLDAFQAIADAVRVEMTTRPPFDGVAGARYVVVVSEDGIREVQAYEPGPPCAD
jgi:hypothetical protein